MSQSLFGRARLKTLKCVAGLLTAAVVVSGVEPPAQAVGLNAAAAEVPSVEHEYLDDLPDAAPIRVGEGDHSDISAPATSNDPVLSPTADEQTIGIDLPADSAIADVTADGTAVYADSDGDFSLAVQQVDTSANPDIDASVRSIITIESEQAPTEYRFPLTLPEGASIDVDSATGTVAVTDSEGGVIGAFGSPWAVDASGADIETSFTVEGDELVQHVKHAGAQYPVIADPVWFVPVVIAGVRIAAPIVVRAASSAAAKQAAKRIASKMFGSKRVKKVDKPKKATYRSYTKSNLRHNLIVRTGKNPKHCQAHHTLPVKFEYHFKKSGINIHDPKYAVWWSSEKGLKNNHQSLAKKYNDEWDVFFEKSRSKKAILDKRAKMHNAYKKYYQC